jgi:ABC-type sugar transport system substrate-binding protein
MAKPKIALHLITTANAYQLQSKDEAEATARRLDVDLDLQFADADATRQIHQIYEHIHSDGETRPAVLIIEAVRDGGIERVVRNAANAGIGVILIHGDGSCIETVRHEHPDVPLTWVTADNRAIGSIQGRQFRALAPKGGLVLYATGPTASKTAQSRIDGAQDALTGSDLDIDVVAGGDWTSATGEKAVSGWLRLVVPGGIVPKIVGCGCDDIAEAAKKALRETARTLDRPDLARIPVTGVDGVPSLGQRLVTQGELAATVIMPVATGPAIGTRPPRSCSRPRRSRRSRLCIRSRAESPPRGPSPSQRLHLDDRPASRVG